jgi:hypothetical protein
MEEIAENAEHQEIEDVGEYTVPHVPARPMEVVKDKHGSTWLCDKGVDPEGDLFGQGCWRCGDLAFTRSG